MKSSNFWAEELILNEFTVFKGITPAVDRILRLARTIANAHRCSCVVIDCTNHTLCAVHPREDQGEYISAIIVNAICSLRSRKETVCQSCLVI